MSGKCRLKLGVRRLLGVIAVGTLATLGFAGVASANHTDSPAPAPYQDSAWGAGTFCQPGGGPFCALFHTNAKSDFDGSNPQGTGFAHITAGGDRVADVYVRVTCLNVVGNQAVVGSEITMSSNPGFLPPGIGALAQYTDNGEPGSNSTTPDRGFATPVPTPPVVCPPPGFFPDEPVTQGNFVVHDALVAP